VFPLGNESGRRSLSGSTQKRETAVKTTMTPATTVARMMLAGTLVLSIGSAASAQQAQTGIVTQVNRLNGTVVVRQIQPGTVGATPGAPEEFKAPNASLDALHAGDRVSFTATETGGVKTITKIDRQ
jgi:Cu/Ag efflux protein CusF